MLFECQNPECKKHFHYTAKLTEQIIPNSIYTGFPVNNTETSVCPFCLSKEFIEYIPPVEPTEQPVNVLVIDLTTGPQLQVDRALADGYKIVNRYAKSYVLEKCGKVEAKTE
jgi:hypothetical protein